jgi:hypothetical protein
LFRRRSFCNGFKNAWGLSGKPGLNKNENKTCKPEFLYHRLCRESKYVHDL